MIDINTELVDIDEQIYLGEYTDVVGQLYKEQIYVDGCLAHRRLDMRGLQFHAKRHRDDALEKYRECIIECATGVREVTNIKCTSQSMISFYLKYDSNCTSNL